MRWSRTRRLLLVICSVGTLAACDGGGGGAPSARTPLPALSQDINPLGDRLDLRSRNYFPMAPGDAWTYEQQRNGVATGQTLTRSVTAGVGSDVVITESMPSEGTVSLTYRRTVDGVVVITPLAGDVPPAAAQQIGNVVEYPEPFYPVGATRQVIRQGNFGEDLDGDGVPESFRLEISQVLVGFESVTLPSGTLADVAHFHSASTLTLQPSNRGYETGWVTTYEDAWWAPGIGMVRAERSAVDSTGADQIPLYALVLKTAQVDGQDPLAPKPDGTVRQISLVHNGLAFDRTRGVYYASIPGSVPGQGNRIATITASTGDVSYSSQTVGSEPWALAVSADGAALYVGLNGSGEVAKLRLPDLAEQWRARLPVDAFFGQLKAEQITVSPLDADTAAVSTFRPGISPRHSGVSVLRAGAVLPTMTQEHTGSNLVVFDGNGQFVYGFNNETTEFGLRRIALQADGLHEEQVVATTGAGFISRAIDWAADRVVVGTEVRRTPDLALVGQAGTSGSTCRFASASTLVCLPVAGISTQDLALHVVDVASLATTATPRFVRGASNLVVNEFVTGPAGQVALRLNATYFSSAGDAIWLFTSPMLP